MIAWNCGMKIFNKCSFGKTSLCVEHIKNDLKWAKPRQAHAQIDLAS